MVVMFDGVKINVIEDCVVLYMVLCVFVYVKVEVDGENVVFVVYEVFECMVVFVDKVCSGAWLGYI